MEGPCSASQILANLAVRSTITEDPLGSYRVTVKTCSGQGECDTACVVGVFRKHAAGQCTVGCDSLCFGCMACVAVCPAEGALGMALPQVVESMQKSKRKRNHVPAWAMAAGIALLFLGLVGFAKATGHWNSHVPSAVYRQLVPNANMAQHPMP